MRRTFEPVDRDLNASRWSPTSRMVVAREQRRRLVPSELFGGMLELHVAGGLRCDALPPYVRRVVELADTSAWWWSARAGGGLRQAFDEAVVEGRIATCDLVRLELLHGARNAGEFRATRDRLGFLPDCPIAAEQWQRALDVYEALAGQGGKHQRAVKHADLLIAAAAEAAGMAVLHYDEDFDRIAAVTGQPARWLAPRGSL